MISALNKALAVDTMLYKLSLVVRPYDRVLVR